MTDTSRDYLWHPYTRRSDADKGDMPVIAGGDGVYLVDTEGRKYFDAISSWWACALGHGNPRLVRAMTQQANQLQHSILGNMSHPPALLLARKLAELTGGKRHVMFASDGASAVEAALKICAQFRNNIGQAERNVFVAFENAYHGDTLGAVSIGFTPDFHGPFQHLIFPAERVPPPRCATCPQKETQCDMRCLNPMKDVLERNRGRLSAVVVESLCQGAAGMNIYPARYLSRLAEMCTANDALLVVDEIAMGFGRTGRVFAYEHAEIRPDIICVGKALSGGYLPISATIVDDRIYDTFADNGEDHTFYHGHTFAGNPIAAAVSLEAISVYEEKQLPEHAQSIGEIMRREAEPIRSIRGVLDVRTLGMILAVELDTKVLPDATLVARKVRNLLLEQHVLIRPLGPVIYLMPPLITPRELICETISLLGSALNQEAGGAS